MMMMMMFLPARVYELFQQFLNGFKRLS